MGRMGLLAVVLGLSLLAGSQAFTLRARHGKITHPPAPHNSTGLDWALLIAGSAGWGNYRHQADICHVRCTLPLHDKQPRFVALTQGHMQAYQVLRDGGLPEERIVVMMADDIAHNPLNPHPGKIINAPGGPDVYAGVPKDYTGPAVNVENFLAVLLGTNDSLTSVGTSGKVVASGPDDRVFVYYSDHGAPGILGMPYGSFLYADQIQRTLRAKAAAKGFADLVFYIEACESGSIFQGMLDDSLDVYATTASNAFESSWGTYCPGMAPSPGPEFTTCLGDLYSVAFLENSDTANLANETLEVQYELVQQRTSNNFTYQQGSHVLQFGSKVIDEEPAGDYLGVPESGRARLNAAASKLPAQNVLQRDADLLHLWTVFQRANTTASRAQAQHALGDELAKRNAMESILSAVVEHMLVMPPLQESWLDTLVKPQVTLEGIMSGLMPGDPAKPIVDDWDCLRGMVDAWQSVPIVGQYLDQSTMRHTGAFANLCNMMYTPAELKAAMWSILPHGTESPLERVSQA